MTISPKRIEELRSISDADIDLSDIPELDESFWDKAKMIQPANKKAISLRLDQEVLDWFKDQGKGYKSLINSVLRSYVEHQAKTKNSG